MIVPILPQYDDAVAAFWVSAWQALFSEIDFNARKPWLLDHLAMMRGSGHIVRGYVEGDAPLAFYTLYPETGLIEQICVSPLVGRGGLGALLIKDAQRQTGVNLNLVVNEDNAPARKFYRKLGFVEVARGVNPDSYKPTISLLQPREGG
jgi:putative acetyltransferase